MGLRTDFPQLCDVDDAGWIVDGACKDKNVNTFPLPQRDQIAELQRSGTFLDKKNKNGFLWNLLSC